MAASVSVQVWLELIEMKAASLYTLIARTSLTLSWTLMWSESKLWCLRDTCVVSY